MSFWVWSRSNDIIFASSNPTNRFTPRTLTPPKRCHQTPLFLPPQPLRQMTLSWQTTTSSSSSSSSIEERVWSRRIVLSHAGQVRFSDKIHCSHVFLHQERSTICSSLVCLWAPMRGGEEGWVSSGDGPMVDSERFYPWTVKREREFEINLWWDYLKERIWSIWIFGGGPLRLVFWR